LLEGGYIFHHLVDTYIEYQRFHKLNQPTLVRHGYVLVEIPAQIAVECPL
jgi:hypothetical protein